MNPFFLEAKKIEKAENDGFNAAKNNQCLAKNPHKSGFMTNRLEKAWRKGWLRFTDSIQPR